MECAGGVDGSGFFTGHHIAFSVLGVSMFPAAPFAGGVEVFQTKANRIDLAMAAGALGFLHVGREFLPLGERLVVEARKLRHIGRCRGRRRVHQVAQHPGPALNRAAFPAVAAHGMDRSHSQKSTTRRIFRKADFTVVISSHAFQTVVRGHETIDDNVVALEKVLQLSLILRPQQVEDRLVNFFPRCRPRAFIEFAMSLDIELEEIQSLHVQPLMSETGNEVVRSGVLNQTIDLCA